MQNKSFASTLYIQKVENNVSSEEMTKIIKDDTKIEKLLTMIEGLRVSRKNSENAFATMKSNDVYMFAFSRDETIGTGEIPYSFTITAEGTFIFTYNAVGSPGKPRVTMEKHPELVEKIKKLLEIDF